MKILEPDFERLDVETDSLPAPLSVSDEATQSIARLFVYDRLRRVWTPLSGSINGVSVSQVLPSTPNISVVTLTTSLASVLAINERRVNLKIVNSGSGAIEVATSISAPSTQRLSLLSRESFDFGAYIGALFARGMVMGETITIIESVI